MTTAAVVLAAGEGSRFSGETHKLLTVINTKPVIRWSVEHAEAAGLDEVIVVQGAVSVADVLPQSATIIENHDWAQGQARSLQVATRYAQMVGHDVIVVGLGDQPLVAPSCWRNVAATDETPIAAASFGGTVAPPTRLSNDVWPLLPIDGDEGARSLLRTRSELVTEVPSVGRAFDVDTLSDLDRVAREMRVIGTDGWD